jgi:hypothetical protein
MNNAMFLRIPLSKLHHIDDVNTFTGLTDEELSSLTRDYSANEIRSIIDAVKWALLNPTYDFSSLLSDINHSNTEILQYLRSIDASLSAWYSANG